MLNIFFIFNSLREIELNKFPISRISGVNSKTCLIFPNDLPTCANFPHNRKLSIGCEFQTRIQNYTRKYVCISGNDSSLASYFQSWYSNYYGNSSRTLNNVGWGSVRNFRVWSTVPLVLIWIYVGRERLQRHCITSARSTYSSEQFETLSASTGIVADYHLK